MNFFGKPPSTGTLRPGFDLHVAVWLAPAAMMLLAMAPLPYGYYTLLRMVACGAAGFLAYRSHRVGLSGWAALLAGVAIIYNPLLPLHLGRPVWTFVNPVTALILVLHYWAFGRKRR